MTRTDLFDYSLPEALIAQRPAASRQAARVLVLEPGGVRHKHVRDLPELLPERALIVFNQTRVRRARILGRRDQTGGRVELLLLEPHATGLWSALGKANRPLKSGDAITAPGLVMVVEEKRLDGTLMVRLSAEQPEEAALDAHGRLPLPPYIHRDPDADDDERYQTVFARQLGSVAAPTAGLHFSQELLHDLVERGFEVGYLTLHVGVGTFRPVTAPDLEEHDMHSEHVEVSAELVQKVQRAREQGRRVVAIGTTVVRALESAATAPGCLAPLFGPTRLFIKPGYRFRIVNGLFTNFHMPKSTLLAMVAAFAGYDLMMKGYRSALDQRYRFLSYGDAMWIPECYGSQA